MFRLTFALLLSCALDMANDKIRSEGGWIHTLLAVPCWYRRWQVSTLVMTATSCWASQWWSGLTLRARHRSAVVRPSSSLAWWRA